MRKLIIPLSIVLAIAGSSTGLAQRRAPQVPREPVEPQRPAPQAPKEPDETVRRPSKAPKKAVETEEPDVPRQKPVFGRRTLGDETVLRMMAAARPPLAIVRIEGVEGQSSYRMWVRGRVVAETRDIGELIAALPAAGEHRIDVSALSPKQRAVFGATAQRVLRARGKGGVRIVEQAETLFDRNAKVRDVSIHDAEAAPGGRHVQSAALTFTNGEIYKVSVSASVRGVLERFFQKLKAALTGRHPNEDAMAITQRVLRETARESGVDKNDLHLQIRDGLERSILVEMLLRRLIDAC